MKRTQRISALVSQTTSARLEILARETGVKKSRIVEDAILNHLDALEQLPASAIIPTRIVLTKESGEEFLRDFEAEPKPTEALKRLMRSVRRPDKQAPT